MLALAGSTDPDCTARALLRPARTESGTCTDQATPWSAVGRCRLLTQSDAAVSTDANTVDLRSAPPGKLLPRAKQRADSTSPPDYWENGGGVLQAGGILD